MDVCLAFWGGDCPGQAFAEGGRGKRGNDTSRSTGRSGRQNAATGRNMRRAERATVQGPVKEQQPDGMSHGGGVRATPSLAPWLGTGASPACQSTQ